MAKKNIVVISLDEVRPDHLSCYGYKKINSTHIDQVAEEGVRFETCISTADFTPIAMGTVITGKYPNKHGMRDAYSNIVGPTIGEIFKKNGYKTAGFVGNGLLAKQHGFGEGFDFWSESSKEKSWMELKYAGSDVIAYEGNWWLEEFVEWLKNNHKDSFCMWGHLYETHEGSEESLLKRGLIKKGELPDLAYYDAKIKMADEKLIGRLLMTLDELNISDDTIVVVMSDHGTNLGEHPAKQIPWRAEGHTLPQHTTMYDHDLKVVMIMKGVGLPKGKVVKGMVGSVDLLPTLMNLVGISTEGYDLDGTNLLPVIEKAESKGREIYSEDLFEPRGEGALQSIRHNDIKFMRNLTLGTEGFYDLAKDPKEKNNIIGKIDKDKVIKLRKKLNVFLKSQVSAGKQFSQEAKDQIDQRLRGLGYIE